MHTCVHHTYTHESKIIIVISIILTMAVPKILSGTFVMITTVLTIRKYFTVAKKILTIFDYFWVVLKYLIVIIIMK